jgi:cell division septation protein DedD
MAATPPPTAAASAAAGEYVVQVSSQRSEADAQASFRSLQEKFPSQLGDRTAIVRRADLGAKGIYYRALTGPFASAGDADQFCSSLKAAGGQCIIQRN